MKPHEQRVVDEKTELETKLTKLDEFICDNPNKNPLFLTLPEAEQSRLKRQAEVMREYASILTERIAAFPQ